MNRFLRYLSNTDPEIMKYCTARARMLQELLGAMILFTGVMAFASGSYAVFTFTEQIPISLIVGSIYAFGIIQFDRFVITSSSRWATITRIPLALIIGLAVSMPLETYIFHKRIDEVITRDTDIRNALLKDSLLAPHGRLRAEIDSIRQDAAEQADLFQRENEYASKELTGSTIYSPGRTWSQKTGAGPNYENAKQNAGFADQRRKELEILATTLQIQLSRREDSINLVFERKKKLPTTDLLNRIEALEKIKANSPDATKIAWIIRILLVLFEIFPAISKFFLDKTEYYTLLEARDHLNKQQAIAIANSGMKDMEERPLEFVGNEEPSASYFSKIKRSIMR